MEKFVCKIDPKIIYDLNNQISKNRIINWAPDYNDQAGISFDDLSYILDFWKNKDVFAYIKSQDNRWHFENDRSSNDLEHYF